MTKPKPKAEVTKEEIFGGIEPPETSFEVISIDLIDDPERPMRSDLTPQSVEDLVVSIRQVGIIEPLVVKPKNNRYEIIAGHRRLTAAQLANLSQVPCYKVNANSEQTELLKIHENLYRAEVKPSDEAEHFKYLMERFKISPIKVAQLISKSPSYVSDRMAIFNYPQQLRDALDKKQITFSVAKEFCRMEDINKMNEYLWYAIRSGITADLARKWVNDWKSQTEIPKIEENQYYNPQTGTQEVEYLTQCIYCRENMKMLEAIVVYIHQKCLDDINNPQTEQFPTPEPIQ